MAMASANNLQNGGLSFQNDEMAVSRDFPNGGPPVYFERDAYAIWWLTCS